MDYEEKKRLQSLELEKDFVIVLLESLPNLTDLQKRYWAENPRKVEKQLHAMFDIDVHTSDIFGIPIDFSAITTRLGSILRKHNITNLNELKVKNEFQLLEYRNFGRGCLEEAKALLAKHDLSLGTPPLK